MPRAPNKTNLTQEELHRVLAYDRTTGVFTWKVRTARCVHIGAVAGSVEKSTGYITISVNSTRFLAHRLAWLYIFGDWPTQEIDHINKIKTDNRIENLRDVCRQENAKNAKKPEQSQWGRHIANCAYMNPARPFRVVIPLEDGTKRYLGYFASNEEALITRDTELGKLGYALD